MFAEVIAGNWLSQAAAWWLPILLDAAIKGTVVLGVAGMTVLFMRRGSAAARHLVWTLGLVSLMLLPVLSAALPAWQVLPSWLSWNQPAAQADAAGISPASTSSPAQPGIAFPPDRRESLAGGRASAAPAIAGTAARWPAPVAEAAPPAETALAQTAASVSSNAASPYVAAAAMFIWLAGAAWALLPAGIACLSLWRLGRRSPRIHGGPWRALVDRLSAELGLRRRVAILCSPNRRMPMVWGILRPKLLIPADACAWSAQRLRAVLLHELAHVRRHDCLVHWVAQLARAIHWFNPLAWIASRRAAMESERACDDAVLTHGFAAPDYAQHLLEIAGGYRVRQWEASAAIAMARSSRLETRFLAILDGGRNRRRVTLRRALLAVAIGVGATALLAIIQPGKDVNTQAFAGAPGQALKPAADAKAPAKSAKKLAAPPTAAEQGWVEFRGQVVDDETGRPVEQFGTQWGWPDPGNPSRIVWGGSSTSSSRRSEGRFSERSGSQAGKKIGLRILADGYLPQPVTPDPVVYPSTNINLTVRMRRGGEARGRVLDHAGKPVAGATVYLAGSQMLDLVDGKAEHFSGSTAMTDEQGRFSLGGAGGAEGRLVIASAPLAVWTAAVPEAGKEATIKLPEPALLKVRSEISGAGGQVRLHLELKTWEMEGWKGFVGARKYLDAPNPGDVTFAGLTPGTYDFWRVKELSVGDFGKGMFLDRRTITLEPGKTTLAEFVRKGGHPIVGQLTGLKDTGVVGAFISVKDGKASGDPRKIDEWKLPVFDADVCAVDGQFKTETIPPGEYTVAAEAYKPEDRSGGFRSGRRMPDFVGTAKVTVRAEGPPPQVRIEMKPYRFTP